MSNSRLLPTFLRDLIGNESHKTFMKGSPGFEKLTASVHGARVELALKQHEKCLEGKLELQQYRIFRERYSEPSITFEPGSALVESLDLNALEIDFVPYYLILSVAPLSWRTGECYTSMLLSIMGRLGRA